MFQAYAASEAKAELKPFEYELGTFEGKEVLPSLFVLNTLVAVGSSSGFDVQTSNMINE